MSYILDSLSKIIFKQSPQGLLILDIHQKIIDANPLFCKLSAFSKKKLLNQTLIYSKSIQQALLEHQYWKGKITLPHQHLQKLSMKAEIYRIQKNAHTIDLLICSVSQFNLKDEHELWKKAYIDQLTNLPNAYLIKNQLKKLIKLRKSFAFFYLDIDGFKKINDLWGHQIGDQLLKKMANRLIHYQKNLQNLGRLHGDEFVLIFEGSTEKYKLIAEKIQKLFKKPFLINSHSIYLTISMGICIYPNDAKNIQEILNRADGTMMRAKKLGTNKIEFYNPKEPYIDFSKLLLNQELKTALNQNQFEIYLQPIYQCSTQKIEKAEALIRWNHPTHGLITSTNFLPMIQGNDLVIELNEWVFHEACKHLPQLKKICPKIQISINTPSLMFQFPRNPFKFWLDILKKYNLSHKQLIIEITEETRFKPTPQIFEKLKSLQKKGLDIALDDYGTGYISLSYLKFIPCNLIKINHVFTKNIHQDQKNQILCQALIDLAHRLNIEVIAEDVEHALDQKKLEELGVDFIQGYIIAPPMDITSFEKLLMKQKP